MFGRSAACLKRFQNWCSPASPGSAALQRRVRCGPTNRFEALHGFFNAVLTRQMNEPILCIHTHIDSRYFVALVFRAR
jgi:hypothetical protein